MPINVQCPGCSSKFRVGDKFAGRSTKCPKCGAVICIPGNNRNGIQIGREGTQDANATITAGVKSNQSTSFSSVHKAVKVGILSRKKWLLQLCDDHAILKNPKTGETIRLLDDRIETELKFVNKLPDQGMIEVR